MKRPIIALALVTALIIATACGSKEEESTIIATAVPTYTVIAPGAPQTTAPETAREVEGEQETEEEHAADSEAEKTADVAAPAEEEASAGADAETAMAETSSEAAVAEEMTEETAQEDAAETVETPEPADEAATETAESDQADEAPAESEPPAEGVETDGSTTPETAEQDGDESAEAEQDAQSDEGATAGADIYAGLPEAIAVLMPDADPARGEQISLQNGCIGCHNLDPNLVMAGPTWYNLGTTAETRVEGMTAAQYIHTSIVNTNDYIVEGFAANIMVSTYGETLSEQDQADLVAYLLGLHE